MKVLLKSFKGTDCLELGITATNINTFIEEELDGAEIVNIVIDIAKVSPVIIGSIAATLTAMNKSIDEFKKLTINVLRKHPQNESVGVYEKGLKALGPDATTKEIDAYFDELKKSKITNRKLYGDLSWRLVII